MSLFSTGPFSYNRFDEMDKAYHKLYEKKAAKDYDGDGKVESGKEEYFGSRDKAIKKAMGKTVKEGKGEMPDFIKKKMDEKKKEGCSCKESVDYLLEQGVDLSEYTWKEMEELFYEGMHREVKTGKVVDKAKPGVSYYPNMPKQKTSVALRKEKEAKNMKEEVCDYLIDRGYTNNEVSAEVLFNHMSDEWINQILEEG